MNNRAKSERANSQPWFWCGDVLKDPVGACNASLMVCFSTCRVINWSGAAPAMSPLKGAAPAEPKSMRVLLSQCHNQRVLHQQSRNQCGCYSSYVTIKWCCISRVAINAGATPAMSPGCCTSHVSHYADAQPENSQPLRMLHQLRRHLLG